jgi:hypothetical protein
MAERTNKVEKKAAVSENKTTKSLLVCMRNNHIISSKRIKWRIV